MTDMVPYAAYKKRGEMISKRDLEISRLSTESVIIRKYLEDEDNQPEDGEPLACDWIYHHAELLKLVPDKQEPE